MKAFYVSADDYNRLTR